MNYVLDTDVLIEIFRGNTVVRDQVWDLRRQGHTLCYSPVTRAELFAGLRAGEEMLVAQILARLACLLIDSDVGEKAGRYMNAHRASHNLEIADALVASSTVLAGAELITFNARHYPMTELKLHHLARS